VTGALRAPRRPRGRDPQPPDRGQGRALDRCLVLPRPAGPARPAVQSPEAFRLP